jgi:hypothetical protein
VQTERPAVEVVQVNVLVVDVVLVVVDRVSDTVLTKKRSSFSSAVKEGCGLPISFAGSLLGVDWFSAETKQITTDKIKRLASWGRIL